MNFGDSLTIVSHIINLAIFVYFVAVLIKLSALDYAGLLISAFGIFISLLAGIVSALETRTKKEVYKNKEPLILKRTKEVKCY